MLAFFGDINTIPVNVTLITEEKEGKEDSSSSPEARGKDNAQSRGSSSQQRKVPHLTLTVLINKSTYSAARVLYPYLWQKHVQSHWHQCQM